MAKIKLTKENVKTDDEYPFYLSIWCGSEEGTKETTQQILDDQKLRELIEKEIESGQDGRIQSSLMFLQKLLKESKK